MQVSIRIILPIFALAFAFFVPSCSFFERPSGPEMQIVVGNVTHTRDGESQAAVEGQRLEPHDGVVVARGAKLKVAAGTSGIFVNEESSFKVTAPASAEMCAIVVEKGEYYFSARRDGSVLVGRFGDMTITMTDADASFAVAPSGRLAYLCVINGSATVARGGRETVVSACEGAVLDAAGVTKDERIGRRYRDIIERLKGWVGETMVERAVFLGKCRPAPEKKPVEPEEKPDTLKKPDAPPAVDTAKTKQAAPAPRRRAAPPKSADTSTAAKQPAPPDSAAPTLRGTVMIEHITGPRQVYAGEEFTLKCTVTGSGKISGYVWRLKMGGDYFQHKTMEPRITTKLEKAGEYTVVCEVLGEGDVAIAAQMVKVQVKSGRTAISAGGPYSAVQGKPVRLLGNAKSRGSKITQYEWYITSFEKPDAVSPENAIVQHIFTNAGQHKAIFMVRLADGTIARDTAVVNVSDGVAPPDTSKAQEESK